ncbi:hypothetical protein GOBAR_AA22886 [Gossypium barbadense]|uniref:Uncharacterized protein n=1 Tax=Gossypium barbadense TaxID=3634 RepID=A0A2P5X381_GOSBA|nr:hypothetical protein GOBAR_AA22886 [Gossypium barbadense]
MVEISDDERLDKMLEFSSKNMLNLMNLWNIVGEHVDNDHYGVLPLNHDPLISSARRVGDHVDSDHHGLCLPENMEDSQKVSCFQQLIIPYEQFADRVDQLSKSQDSSKGKRQLWDLLNSGIEKHSQVRLKPVNTATVEDPDV